MCGILFTTKEVKPAVVDSIRHRGTYEPVRLQIADMSFVHTLMPVQGAEPVLQPVFRNGKVMLFQGEIWKHEPFVSDTYYLFEQLNTRAIDTFNETYEKVFDSFNGMFSIVFYDKQDIYFCTDIFGEQPLYYSYTHIQGFAELSVASEHKQLRALGVPNNKILPCLPGQLYKFNVAQKTLTQTTYHAFDFSKTRQKTFDAVQLRSLVEASTALKYKSNDLQQSALLLSGGVDSAVMAYELSKLGLRDAFTVSTNRDSLDFKTAEITAKTFGLNLTKVLCKTYDINLSLAMSETKNRSIAEEYVCHLALSKCLADKGYRVAFTGSGADELFCGYQYYLKFLKKDDYHTIQQRFIENYYKMDLRVINKIFMTNAIEIRNPFLTRQLAEYCLTLDVDTCLIGQHREMKFALRESYADIIDSARNKKLIARETMGVEALFLRKFGKDPYAYYDAFKRIFSDNKLLAELTARATQVQYEII